MEWSELSTVMDYLASTGTVFSVEQKVAMQASLTVLRQNNKFNTVHFLGKINGTEKDYWLVCGIGKDYLKDRTFFYSINRGVEWILLSAPSPTILENGLACRGHFSGDPSADAETDIPSNDNFEATEDGDDWITMKEEDRLAATVYGIMNEVAVVPRGALFKTPDGVVMRNKMFEGLEKVDALQLTAYYHLRKPDNPWDKNIVGRADYNLSLDFLESIANDVPIGCWSLQPDTYETVVYARSLWWPGFVAFHVLETPYYGFFYNGTGKKNWDVPYMLCPAPMSAKASVVEGDRASAAGQPGQEGRAMSTQEGGGERQSQPEAPHNASVSSARGEDDTLME